MCADTRSLTDQEFYADHPIATYANRIQHRLEFVCDLVGSLNVSGSGKALALALLIENYPPSGKKALHVDYDTLRNYNAARSYPANKTTEFLFVDIYGRAHDWFYLNVLQDLFKAIPLYRKPGSLTPPKKEDIPVGKGLGVSKDA